MCMKKNVSSTSTNHFYLSVCYICRVFIYTFERGIIIIVRREEKIWFRNCLAIFGYFQHRPLVHVFVTMKCTLDSYFAKWLDSIGYDDAIRRSPQRQRALDSDYKSIFFRAKADVYVATDGASTW